MPRVFVVRTSSGDIPSFSVRGVFESLKRGRARIGWSSDERQDLRLVRAKLDDGRALRGPERWVRRCLGFLTRVSINDFLIYPHQPERHQFAVARVTGEYDFDHGLSDGDFRSVRPCELITDPPLDWYDERVPPTLRRKLGLKGRFYEIYDTDLLDDLLRALAEPRNPAASSRGNWELRLDRIAKSLKEGVPALIQRQFPAHELSRLLCKELLERMGSSVEVYEGAADKGTDLLVTVGSPLFERQFNVGVQAFAYEGEVTEQALGKKLAQLLSGWNANDLEFGVLLTTGVCGVAGTKLIEKHNREFPDRPVRLIDAPILSDLFFTYFYGVAGERAGDSGSE